MGGQEARHIFPVFMAKLGRQTCEEPLTGSLASAIVEGHAGGGGVPGRSD